MSDLRKNLSEARRVVVKIGSRALSRDDDALGRVATDIARFAKEKRRFVVVSSGAIAIGCERLGYKSRPKEMARLQAAAAAGQAVLMRRWDDAFAEHGVTAAQVLLTHADLADRERLNNARQALAALLDAGAVPVVNENDTVATEEIAFGDNDQLASMVVPLVGAELLVLFTDVPGVLDSGGERISVMTDGALVGSGGPRGTGTGTGGMTSKIDAATKASRSGAVVVVAAADAGLGPILEGADVGTLFPATGAALRARKHWIAYTLRPSGTIVLDPGAVAAMQSGKHSLLPVGVVGVRGTFNAGDSVRLVGPGGEEIARGLSRLGVIDVARAAGKKSTELELVFGAAAKDLVVVHKDDLVVTMLAPM